MTEADVGRIAVVDGVRGFALLGILVINLGAFSSAPGGPPNVFTPVPIEDRVVQTGILAVVESKFFSLFSLLFGLSFAIQMESAARRGAAFGPRITRRLLALLGFGVLHVLLLWDGDILIVYAVIGAILVAFRNAADRTLLRWAAGLLALPVVLYAVALAALTVARAVPSTAAALAGADRELVAVFAGGAGERIELLQSGSYAEIARARWAEYAAVAGLLLSRVPTVLAMFLLGMWAGRAGLLRDPEAALDRLRRWCRTAWAVGLPVQAAVVAAALGLPPVNALVALFFDQALAGPVLAVAYGTSLVLWARGTLGRRVLGVLEHPGRMALTTYLMQSVILSFVFWSWGLGLAGQVSALEGLGIAAVIFLAQVLLARAWLRRFRYGPLEWVWRCVTYARRQPLRREPTRPESVLSG